MIHKYERERLLRQSKRRREHNVKMSLKVEGKKLYLSHVLINHNKTKNSATPAGFLYFDD